VHDKYADTLEKEDQNLVALSIAPIADSRPITAPALDSLNSAWPTILRKQVMEIWGASAADPRGTVATPSDDSVKKLATAILQILETDGAYQSALSSSMKDPDLTTKALRAETYRNSAEYKSAENDFEQAVTNMPKGWNGDLEFSQQFPTPAMASATSSKTTTTPPDYFVGEFDLTCDPITKPSKDDLRKGSCPLGPRVTLTGNFSSSFYTNPNPKLNESTLRGGKAALQAQWNLGGGPFDKVKDANDKSKMTLAISGSYERLQENKDQKGKRPDIVLGSGKLEIPISSGLSIPLSISFANASSQVKGNYVFGNFGISFNLDALSALKTAKQ
jgi:hypothetical protein